MRVAKYNMPCYIDRTMTNGTELDRLLAEAAEKIRKEAYAAGWRDAIAAITKAASESAPGDIPAPSAGTDNIHKTTAATGPGPTVGSTPWYVWQAVVKRPGMTGAEVVSVVQDGGHRVPEGSIRTSLTRIRDKKLIVSRHGKWFPA